MTRRANVSAGLLLFRRGARGLELFLAHLLNTDPDPDVRLIIDEIEKTIAAAPHPGKHRKTPARSTAEVPTQVPQNA